MDSLARSARDHPDAPALITSDRVVTYAEVDRAADGVAHQVRTSGTLAGHPVAFWGDRTPEAVAAVWGIPRAGVPAIPVDPSLPAAVSMEATRAVGVRGLWSPPDGGFDRLASMDRSRSAGPSGGYVVMTSGSLGQRKGVRLTAANVDASVAASATRLLHGPGDSWLCVLPLFHVGGLAILWRQAAAGAPVVLHERFDVERAAAALGEVTFASFVPVMLSRMLAAGATGGDRLRVVLVGGAAADVGLLAEARDRGIPAIPTYGMTETASQVATPDPGDPLDGTVGTALPGAELRVVRDGEPRVGVEGRIQVRGAMVSPGYVGEVERAPGEWFVTGDLGVLDSAGRLTVTGRADAVIVTGGENVHPSQVESLLRQVPGIREARVSGMPDAEWGQVIAAEVVTGLSLPELEAAVASFPPMLRPRRWSLVERITEKLDEPPG